MEAKAKQTGEAGHVSQFENPGDTALQAGSAPGAFVLSSMFGPRVSLAPEGGAAAGGGGDAAAAAGSGTPETGSDGGAGAGAPPQRPDYIPESFWDSEKGFKADDLNALVAFKAEHDANLAQVPDAPDGYKLALPKDFKLPEGLTVDGAEFQLDESDPRFGMLRDFAHSRQMSQSDFEGMVAFGVQLDAAEQARLQEALTEQAEKLGTKGKARVEAVNTWLGAVLGSGPAAELSKMLYTAGQVEAFEALMRANRGVLPGNPGGGRDSGKTELSDEEYDKLSPTEKINYARQHSKR
ncbi:hypothetical protein [Gellertiella hungarica]|uniref:Uncharacterized protein n=1 Tax=Gellertiella hungarica TaxID=1572859 RepID=A0A7W6NMA9_9HYPH|nr:hypothetical protein [Gellertiella hungarica]MBB4066758.1 hypothetical protein [Gellertiella hungarica]